MLSPPAREVWIEIGIPREAERWLKSPPAREVWIEILMQNTDKGDVRVSPPAREVWIEIHLLGILDE